MRTPQTERKTRLPIKNKTMEMMKRQMILWMAMLCMVLGVEARPVARTDWSRDLDSLARWLP